MKGSNFILFSILAAAAAGCGGGTTVSVVQNNTTVNSNTAYNDTAEVAVDDFDIDAIIEKMKKRPFRSGYSESAGFWVVCRVDVSKSDNMKEDQMLSLAEIRAKREITAWMSSAVSSEASLERTQVLEDGEGSVKEVYTALTRTSSEAFLRGVSLHSSYTDADGLHAYYFCTGAIVDRTAELEAQLAAAPPGVVRAVGFGMIVDNQITKAKQQAVQTALRNAVEQVMGTTVIGQSQLMDNEKAKSKVISQTVGAVKEYRIVREEKDNSNYQVIINARVDEKNLMDNYAAMVRSMGNPGFAIETEDPDLHIALSDFFAQLGFKVTDNPDDTQFIVDAACEYIDVNNDHYGDGLQIAVRMEIFDPSSGEKILFMQNNPRLTATYSGSYHQIRQSAAHKAFKTMKDELHEKLNKIVMDWVLNGREVTVRFADIPNTEVAECIAEAIAWVPCAELHTTTRDDNGTVYHCSYVGPSADFAGFLLERLRKDLPGSVSVPTVKTVDLKTIEFNF